MVNEPLITPAQLRAARAWLNWSQRELSDHSGVSLRSITRYEQGLSVPYTATLLNLRKTLEAAGIRFKFDGMLGKSVGTE